MGKKDFLQITVVCLVVTLFIFSCTMPTNSTSSQPSSSSNASSSQSSSVQGLVVDFNFDNSNQTSNYQNIGATTVTGVVGNGLKFNGYDNYLLVPNNDALSLTTSGSIEIWINTISFTYCAGLVHKGEKTDFSDEAYTLQFWPPDGTVVIGLTNENGNLLMLATTNQININKWYQIVATWDLNNVNLYINGVLNNSTPNTIGAVRDSSGGLVIGAQLSQKYSDANGNLGFDGAIDNVNLFNRVLSANEVMDRYSKLQ